MTFLRIGREILRNHRGIELVGFALAECKNLIEAGKSVLAFEIGVGEAETDNDRLARANCELVVSCGLRASMVGIHRVRCAMHDVVVDAVFDVRSAVLDSKQPLSVGLILGEEEFWRAFTMQPAIAGLFMIQFDHRVRGRTCLMQLRPTI